MTQSQSQPTQIADTVFINGSIYTVNRTQPWVEAVAILDGRFIYVGDSAGADSFVGAETVTIDLGEKMMMPGLHDMHIHGVMGALGALFECAIPPTATADEVATLVTEFSDAHPGDDVIVGSGWAMGISAEIHANLLDEVCPDRPVFLWDLSLHNAWCNSKMLEIAQIDQTSPDPDGGEIVRDRTGMPTGLVKETAAGLIIQHIPDRSADDYQRAIDWLAKELNSFGVTSIKEAAVNRSMAQAYKSADRAKRLNLRVALHFLWLTPFVYDGSDMEQLVTERHQFAGERVKVDFLKLFLDGVPAAHTAAMLDPYEGDDPDSHDPHKLLLVDPETLKEVLIKFDAEDMLVKMHATGDASLQIALDAIEAARRANGPSGLGHEIAHPQNVHPADLPRFAELGAVPDLCPKLWHPSLNKERVVKAAVGAERVERSWPIGSYLRSGAMMIGGTDWPAMVPTVNLFPSLQTLVTREDPSGQVKGKLGVDQEIDLASAIEIFTINGAKAARHAADCGSIEVGKFADMIILDRNLFDISPHQIGETNVIKTYVEGKLVYKSNQA